MQIKRTWKKEKEKEKEDEDEKKSYFPHTGQKLITKPQSLYINENDYTEMSFSSNDNTM